MKTYVQHLAVLQFPSEQLDSNHFNSIAGKGNHTFNWLLLLHNVVSNEAKSYVSKNSNVVTALW